MDSSGPPPPPHPQGRHAIQLEGHYRAPRRGASHGPLPHSRLSNEWLYHQYPDSRAGSQPWPEARMEHHCPTYHPRLQDSVKPNSRAGYYDSSYPNRPYSRQGHEELYRSSVEDYAHGGHQRYSQDLWDPRQRNTYGEHGYYWDQNYYSNYYQHKKSSSFVDYEDASPIRSKKHNYYEDSYSSNKDNTRDNPYGSTLQPGEIWAEPQGTFPENASVPGYELPMPEEPSLLQTYKETGLSSSSYELSQYMYDSSNHADADWSSSQTEDLAAALPSVAPQKFSLPHVPVCFGPGGQLVRGCPNYPAEGQPALVEIHSLEVILHDTVEQEAMRLFPGPLIREDLHKVDVMAFCQRRATAGCNLASDRDRDSTLLWKLLLLLCRQNGSMVGSDTAELLMHEGKPRERYKRQEPVANLINLTDEVWPVQGCGTPDLLTGEIVPSVITAKQKVEKFTKLLFYGRKKEALDWAMRNQLWGHALFLSSKMDLRTYSWVLSGFTSTLAFNDPLQTLFQLMSGRIPQASLCCGDEKWGDWKPHLAVILSNQVGDAELNRRAIVTMGDTLAGKELIEAAHFCYLMVNMPFGHYNVKSDRLVLLGSSQSQTFGAFARLECIQGTEIFEYCQRLGSPKAFIPSFQVYKLIYASQLVDFGLPAQALHYCEAAGLALLAQDQNLHFVLLQQVIKLAERLKLSDPRLLERPEQETFEPDWLQELRARHQQWREEDHLLSATCIQQDLPRISGSIPVNPALASQSEVAQRQGHGEDLQQHPPPVDYTQYQSGPDQRPCLHSGSGQPFLPVTGQDPISSPGKQPDGFSSQLSQQPGDPCAPYHTSGDWQNILDQQSTVNARIRSVSESSTISIAEETYTSLEDEGEEDTLEKSPAKNTEQEEAKASGFGWFRWFRSKPNKDAEPARKLSDTAALAIGAPVSQETIAPPAALPPMGEVMSSLPLPPLCHGSSDTFLPSSSGTIGTKEPLICRERATFPSDGHQFQDSSYRSYVGPAGVPPPPRGGSVPLFNPTQAPIAASGVGHPQWIYQQCYPNHQQ